MKFPALALSLTFTLGLAGLSAAAHADPAPTAIGFWLNESQGWVVETVKCDTGVCGYLVSFLKGNSPDHLAIDSQNPDSAKRSAPLCGLMLLGGFTPADGSGAKWEHGWVYDPDTGSTYRGVAEVLDANTITVRGYVLVPLFGKTLTLIRETGAITHCSAAPRGRKSESMGNVVAVDNTALVKVADVRRH